MKKPTALLPLLSAIALVAMAGPTAAQTPLRATIKFDEFLKNEEMTVTFLPGVSPGEVVQTYKFPPGGTLTILTSDFINGEMVQAAGPAKITGNPLTVNKQIQDVLAPNIPSWKYDAGAKTITATLSGEFNYNLPKTTFSCEDGALPEKSPPLSTYPVPAGRTISPDDDWKLAKVDITTDPVPTPKAGQLWACSQTDLGKNKSPVDTQVLVPVVIDAPAPASIAGDQVTLTGTASPEVDLLVLGSDGKELARTKVAADGTYSVTYTNTTPAAASQVTVRAINLASAAKLTPDSALYPLYPKVFAEQTVDVAAAEATDAPVGVADSYTTPVSTVLTTPATTGVLANDTAPAGKVLTAVVVTAPANGTLVLAADGGFTYTPKDKFEGADTFTYIASYDSSKAARAGSNAKAAPFVDSAPVTVTINVTAATTPPAGATAQAVPTLGHAGLVLLSGLVAGAAALRRRKEAKGSQRG